MTRPSLVLKKDFRPMLPLSDKERETLAVLRGNRMSTRAIAEVLWGADDTQWPINALTITSGRLRSIARKLEHNGDPERLRRSPRDGPHAIEWWLVKMRRKQ
jgi:hypothetical protein